MIGTLYGISVGPGDPELITLKGLRRLKQVSVITFPAGVADQPGLAEQIVAEWIAPQQKTLPLHFPYVQDRVQLTQAWETAAHQVWPFLAQGQDVAFVCVGDVSFYSTFTYLAQNLIQQHPEAVIQWIPGVCSPLAAAAALGLPLAQQGQKLAVLPALYTLSELVAVLTWADVVVLLKVGSVYPQVWQLLQQKGLLECSTVVEWATFPQQVIHQDLRDKPNLVLPYFSLLMIFRGLETLGVANSDPGNFPEGRSSSGK